MPLISTEDGQINSQHVVRFAGLRDGRTKFVLSTGDVHYSPAAYTADPAEAFFPIIPANPGFVGVFAVHLEDGSYLYKRRSVIAWRLCPAGNYPLFEGYIEEDNYPHVIIDPDGTVFDCDLVAYATFDDWKAEFEAEAAVPVPAQKAAA